MSLAEKLNDTTNFSDELPVLKGWWQFSKDFSDIAGNGNDLIGNKNPLLVADSELPGTVQLNGVFQWLSTSKAVVDTEGSYTITAWVRLDSSAIYGRLALSLGEHAFTAVSQDSPTHSAFYLGLRQIDTEQHDGVLTSSLRWNFTVAPIDGSETGAVEWQHAYAESQLNDSTLDKWFFLVGVCDAKNRTNKIYVVNENEKGEIHWPNAMVQLPSEGGLQVGRGRWLGRDVDWWPGSVGPIKVFSGAMSDEDVKKLYTESGF